MVIDIAHLANDEGVARMYGNALVAAFPGWTGRISYREEADPMDHFRLAAAFGLPPPPARPRRGLGSVMFDA